ncbi:MAG TPA: hypothetical protein GXX51_03935 [Firmicutes bacterium]|nr:hypothetical protein [Bacillota bacterium]
MNARSVSAVTLGAVAVILVIFLAAFPVGRARLVRIFEAVGGKAAAARVDQAIKSTLALKGVRITEKVSFPSSDKLLSVKDARKLGTGLWERSIELKVSPANPATSATPGINLHYSSISEDANFEAYREGSKIFLRSGAVDNQVGEVKWIEIDAGDLPHVGDALDEGSRAEIAWMMSVKGVDSFLPEGIGEATRVIASREKSLDGIRYIVADIRTSKLDAKFAEAAGKGADAVDSGPEPLRYEVRVWVPETGDAYIARLEETYIYRTKEQETYDYVISLKTFEPDEKLVIKPPRAG